MANITIGRQLLFARAEHLPPTVADYSAVERLADWNVFSVVKFRSSASGSERASSNMLQQRHNAIAKKGLRRNPLRSQFPLSKISLHNYRERNDSKENFISVIGPENSHDCGEYEDGNCT